MAQTLADARRIAGSIQWVWPGWLAKGYVTLLTGRKGLGKSTIAMDWTKRILSEKAVWPDGTEVVSVSRDGQQPFVLWLEAEAGQALNAQRAADMGIDLTSIHLFDPPPKPGTSSDPFRHFSATSENLRWAREAASQEACRMLVLDALSGANGDDENAAKVGKIVLALADIAQSTSKPVLVLHHKSKRQRDRDGDFLEDSLESVRGSSAIVQYARIVVSLDAPSGDHVQPFRLSQLANNLVALPAPLGYSLGKEVKYEDAPEGKKGSGSSPAIEQAAVFLAESLAQGPVAASDLFQAALASGIPERTLRRAKTALGVSAQRQGDLWFWSL